VDAGVGGLRNTIINGQFTHWQRGITFADTVVGYHADRWRIGASDFIGGSLAWTVDRVNFDPGQTDVPNNPTYYLNFASAITGGPGTERTLLSQRIEGVETLSGGEATLSFWAKGSIPGTIVINFRQNTATPSSPFFGNVPIALSTVWRFYVIVVDVPLVAGPVAPGNSLNVHFMTQAGASNPAGVPGFQYTGTVSLANVQFEEGRVNDPDFEIRDVGYELQLCQRYYEEAHKVESTFAVQGINPTNENWFNFKVTKRDVPAVFISIALSPPTGSGVGSLDSVGEIRTDGFKIRFTPTAPGDHDAAINTGPFDFSSFDPWTADAEL
jgi:hypothetical protein